MAMLLATAMLLAPACVAAADIGDGANGWTFARWGMTRAEVEAASNGVSNPTAQDNEDSVTGEQAIGAFRFQVTLEFQDDHLSEIRFAPTFPPKKCAALRGYLGDTYGRPALEDNTGAKISWWRDLPNANTIRYAMLDGGGCSLSYQPMSALSIVN
jgi:hypothetical protein